MELKCNSLGEAETAEHVLAGEYATPVPQAPAVVLDIGANVGAFSRWARQTWPEAKIIAYEPQERAASLFVHNLGSEASLVQSAVSNYHGKAKLHCGVNNSCQAGLVKQSWNNGETEEVDVVDGADLPAADFVKIDTEGSELDILRRLDLSRAQAVALEYHKQDDFTMIHGFMAERGFHLHERFPTLNGCGVGKWTKGTIPGRLFVAMPVYGAMPWEFVYCLENIQRATGKEVIYAWKAGDSLVSRARNRLTADFLETNCTHMLWIDTDLVFSKEHVDRMMSHQEEIVGGCYPKKQVGDVQWVLNVLDPPNESVVRSDGLQEVKYVGTGFMRIHRSVFERMIQERGQDMAYRCDSTGRLEYDFWKVGVCRFTDGTARYLSEDWYFCQNAIDLGYRIWADTRTVLKHLGQVAFPVGGAVPLKG